MAALFQNVLTASFHGSIVIAAVLVLRLVLKKAPRKFVCMLWLLVGLRLLMPFELQSPLSLQPEPMTVTAPVQSQQPVQEVSRPDTPVILPSEAVAQPEPTNTIPETVPVEVESGTLPESDPVTQPISLDLMMVLPWLWFGVACGFALHTLVSYLRLKVLVRDAVKIPGGWESDKIETAFILGFVKPKIYIPVGMDREVRRHILAHERTHLEKGDHWIKLLGFVALSIHWFNPLVWLAYGCLCRDIETACDERVVQFMELAERKRYASALLSCSSNRVHYGACPVAFGEARVKERIKAVLKYKRPSFWISLLGVIAIAFVAVCLLTSPITEPEELPVIPDTTETIEAEPQEVQSTFAETLSEEEILDAITDGIRELCSRESCRAISQNSTVYPAREDAGDNYTTEIYRYGNDVLLWNQMDLSYGEGNPIFSKVFFGDTCGVHLGDYWVSQGSRKAEEDINEWIKNYSPEGKTVTAVRIESDSTVCYEAEWSVLFPANFSKTYSGTIWVTFHDDGTLASLSRKYQEKPALEGEDAYYQESTLTILEDPDPQETYRTIADQAVQCLTEAEVEAVRRNRNTMTEIPSNKTDYDQNFTTGCVSRQWEFLEKSWHVRIGSEEVTPTGLRQTFAESGDGHASFAVEEGFWIETFDGANWKLLREPLEMTPAESRSISVAWESGDSFALDWSDSYGQLGEGYYRLGRYYTVTMADGRTETLPCYCKFQIRNQEMDALLKECELGVAQLAETSDYYIKTWDYLRNEEFHHNIDADSHDMVEEIWRSGNDYYGEITYRYKSDGSTKSVRGTLLRNGKGYDIDNGTVTQVDWIDKDSFERYVRFATTFSATDIIEVYKDPIGTIHVKEQTDFYEGIPFKEQRYSFTEDGRLTGYQRVFFNEAGEEIVDFEMERYRTAEGETRQKIDSISVQ